MKTIGILSGLVLMSYLSAAAQGLLWGLVTTCSGRPLAGVNVYVKGSFDGTVTDSSGRFACQTTAPFPGTLIASMVGFETTELELRTPPDRPLTIAMQEVVNELNAVVITAGSFDAGDTRRTTVLKPMDILTTAGSTGDITTALQTLPGAQRVGDTEGLFVRGGSGAETRTIIDGTLVESPFFSSTPDVAQRMRFSPALFRGTSFSTGGFSAQYGQALSSVMLLTTRDSPDSSQTSVALTLAGGNVTDARRWRKTSLRVDGTYANLGPLFRWIPQRINWIKAPINTGGTLLASHQFKSNSQLKVLAYYSQAQLALNYVDAGQTTDYARFDNRNSNVFVNVVFRSAWREGTWILTGSGSFSCNRDDGRWNGQAMERFQQRTQGRLTLVRMLGTLSSLTTGLEGHAYQFADSRVWSGQLQEHYGAAFVEAEVYPSARLAVRAGVRADYTSLGNAGRLALRLSMAYKTGLYSQVSMAFGQFYQSPENRFRLIEPGLKPEQATHYLINYQYARNNRTVRLEAYAKDYRALVREWANPDRTQDFFRVPVGPMDNSGSGYARGVDVFLRDRRSIRGGDGWVSYSWLNTRRLYQNLPVASTPMFAATHTLNLVYKHYLPNLKSYVGLTGTWASGRPYYNPNAQVFLSDRTPAYQDLSLNWNYITRLKSHFMVVFASVSNVLGVTNIFGYRYSVDGTQHIPIGQSATRTYFLGTYVSFRHR